MLPIRSATPKISAGDSVSARNASVSDSPIRIALRTPPSISAVVCPSEENANFTPLFANIPGVEAALARVSKDRVVSTASGSASAARVGHFVETITGQPAAFNISAAR